MSDLGLIIFAIIFGYIFFGPHMKSKPKDDKEGKQGKK